MLSTFWIHKVDQKSVLIGSLFPRALADFRLDLNGFLSDTGLSLAPLRALSS